MFENFASLSPTITNTCVYCLAVVTRYILLIHLRNIVCDCWFIDNSAIVIAFTLSQLVLKDGNFSSMRHNFLQYKLRLLTYLTEQHGSEKKHLH